MTTSTTDVRRLKQDLAAQERGRGKRYDTALRARVVQFAEQRRSEGRSWMAIATELGARFETVRRWCEAARPKPKTALAVRPVEIVDAPRASGGALAIVTPRGLRIEGLALEHVVALVRALG